MKRPETLLSARLMEELAALLRAASARAAALGAAVTAAHSIELGDLPAPLEAFTHAERLGERRFYAAHPGEGTERLGLGSARACALRNGDAAALREATRSWLERLELHPHAAPGIAGEGPFVCSGLAFEPRAARSTEWAPFGSAAAWLPELGFERRGEQCRLHFAASLEPAASGAREASVQRALARFELLLGKADLAPARIPEPAPDDGVPVLGDRSYRAALLRALEGIARGEAQKLVLARAEDLRLPGSVAVAQTLRALRSRHRDCLSFACGIGAQTFLGATPERLVRRAGNQIEAWAVAATTARGASSGERAALARELRSSSKQREEHALVVRGIERALAPLCRTLDAPEAPSLVETGTVQHLRTRLRAELSAPAHVLELVGRIHPTPAVAGAPRAAALEWIRRHESFDRGWYAGPLGWFDAAGQGDFFVALRCALVSGERARLFAGSGLVAGSVAEEEAAETALKLRSVREALHSA